MPRVPQILRFPELDRIAGIRAAFLARVPDLDVAVDREVAMATLAPIHQASLASLGFHAGTLATAAQIHGNTVAIATASFCSPGADALICNRPGICLGIYVADCAPVYFVDPVRHAIGLAHSGKKGTELEIVIHTVEAMQTEFGSEPQNLIAQIGPCISPPDYDIDFRADILRQLQSLDLGNIHDCGLNTAADFTQFYSYRKELGKTGRMLAALELIAR